MPKGTPSSATEKWQRNTKAATQDYANGVQGVSEAPGVRAAKQADKMRQNILKSLDDGTWQKRVAGVSLNDWKQKTLAKGPQRIASGVDGAVDKMGKFMSELYPHQQAIQDELENMPSVTLEDSIARAVHNMRRMSEFKRD